MALITVQAQTDEAAIANVTLYVCMNKKLTSSLRIEKKKTPHTFRLTVPEVGRGSNAGLQATSDMTFC